MRDCDHCRDGTPPTRRVTPWEAGARRNDLRAYLCADHAEAHREALHDKGFGCVEMRPVFDMAKIVRAVLTQPCSRCYSRRVTCAVIMSKADVELPERHVYLCGECAQPFASGTRTDHHDVREFTVPPQFRTLHDETQFLHLIPERE